MLAGAELVVRSFTIPFQDHVHLKRKEKFYAEWNRAWLHRRF